MEDLTSGIVSDNSVLKSENASWDTSSSGPTDIQQSLDVSIKLEKTEVSIEEEGSKKRSSSTFEGVSLFGGAFSEQATKKRKEEENTSDNNPDYEVDREVSLS